MFSQLFDLLQLTIRYHVIDCNFQSCFSEPFIVGGQPDDDRIYVEERVERAPDYTEGEQE